MNNDLKPRRKVVAGTAGGSSAAFITVLIVWMVKNSTGIEIPSEVAAAITGLLTVVVGAFSAYMTPSAPPKPRPADKLTDLDVAMVQWITAERTEDPPGWPPRRGIQPSEPWPVPRPPQYQPKG